MLLIHLYIKFFTTQILSCISRNLISCHIFEDSDDETPTARRSKRALPRSMGPTWGSTPKGLINALLDPHRNQTDSAILCSCWLFGVPLLLVATQRCPNCNWQSLETINSPLLCYPFPSKFLSRTVSRTSRIAWKILQYNNDVH